MTIDRNFLLLHVIADSGSPKLEFDGVSRVRDQVGSQFDQAAFEIGQSIGMIATVPQRFEFFRGCAE